MEAFGVFDAASYTCAVVHRNGYLGVDLLGDLNGNVAHSQAISRFDGAHLAFELASCGGDGHDNRALSADLGYVIG